MAAAEQYSAALQIELWQIRVADRRKQVDLAMRVGVAERVMRYWEHGHASPSLVHFIAWGRENRRRLALQDTLGSLVELPSTAWRSGESWGSHEYRQIAYFLTDARRATRWTQTDLALLLGSNRTSVGYWESAQKAPAVALFMLWAARFNYFLVWVAI